MAIEMYARKSKFTELKPFCHHAKDNDFMELTRWTNEEGFDVTINNKIYSFTDGEFECLLALWSFKE